MVDPLTTLGVAANVIQLLAFAGNLLSKGREIRDTAYGAPVAQRELETVTESLRQLSANLRRSKTGSVVGKDQWGALTQVDRELNELCKGCHEVSDELLSALKALKTPIATTSHFTSLYQAFRCVISESKIDDISKRIEAFRRQIDTTLLVSIRQQIHCASEESKIRDAHMEQVSHDLRDFMDRTSAWQTDLVDTVRKENWQPIQQHDLNMFSAKFSKIALEQREDLHSRRITELLRFSQMADRYESIAKAHQNTFEWAFNISSDEDTAEERPLTDIANLEHNGSPKDGGDKKESPPAKWDNFAQWLEGSQSFYWVTGKPGSGKSTLMKFLANDSRTLSCARNWSKGRKLSILGFFFWISGTTMQMSRMGLLQSLLFEILQNQPALVASAFPRRWDSYRLFGGDPSSWSWIELTNALDILVSDTSQNFLFFIDGLDEFDGKPIELSQFVLQLSTAANVKVCAASRPWLAFEDAFGQKPQLKLQDLTRQDIEIFILEKLSTSLVFRSMESLMPKETADLITEITEKANGVFLWVYIVVASLLEGLQDGDTLRNLEERLRELPAELEDLFKKIMSQIHPGYFKEASEIFQLVLAARQPLTLVELSATHEWFSDAVSDPGTGVSWDKVGFQCDLMRRRLTSRCKGLLEIKSGRPDERVTYLHRTVAEFLQQRIVWDFLLTGTATEFNPYATLCYTFLWQVKYNLEHRFLSMPESSVGSKFLWDLFQGYFFKIVHCLRAAEERDRPLRPEVLDDIIGDIHDFWNQRSLNWKWVTRPRWRGIALAVANSYCWPPMNAADEQVRNHIYRPLVAQPADPLDWAVRLQLVSYLNAVNTKPVSAWYLVRGVPLLRIAVLSQTPRSVEWLLKTSKGGMDFDARLNVEWGHLLKYLNIEWKEVAPNRKSFRPRIETRIEARIEKESFHRMETIISHFLDHGAGRALSSTPIDLQDSASTIVYNALSKGLSSERMNRLLFRLRENEHPPPDPLPSLSKKWRQSRILGNLCF